MLARLLLPLIALCLIAAAPVTSVVDGDTFDLGGERIRLWGIDAPEGRQICKDAGGRAFRCGDVARDRLAALVAGKSIDCRQRDRDTYGRSVAQCQVGGIDVGEAMVRSGWAVEYKQFSKGFYSLAEAQAQNGRRGLWAGVFEAPDRWRADQRANRAPPLPPPGDCVIKGNINAKGRRVFHVPGQRDYAATVIDTAKGERWFCSATEAVAAGWGAAQR